MNIKYGNEMIQARMVKTYPSKFRIGDFLLGPDGTPLKVVTVQSQCPLWESQTKTKTVVIFQRADGMIVPVNGMQGVFSILRPKR